MGSVKLVSVGDVFGKLEALECYRELRPSGGWKYLTKLRCECGNIRIVETGNLKKKSFNPECLQCSGNPSGILSHGNSYSKRNEDPAGYNCYTRWQSMKRRCYKEYDSHYKNYGARGIKVCERWLNSYENFLADMGLPPTIEHQIDRIDNDGDYCPENCRWVSRTENARNRTNNKFITAFGKTMTQSQWAEETGIKRETIAMRMRRGWSAELALAKK